MAGVGGLEPGDRHGDRAPPGVGVVQGHGHVRALHACLVQIAARGVVGALDAAAPAEVLAVVPVQSGPRAVLGGGLGGRGQEGGGGEAGGEGEAYGQGAACGGADSGHGVSLSIVRFV